MTQDELGYATNLAQNLWEKHWKEDSPEWKPLPDLLGVLTQIDNMVAGLVRQTPPYNKGKGAGIAFLRSLMGHTGDDCVLWPLHVLPTGYGVIGFNGKLQRANRLMCRMAHGVPYSEDFEAAHSCNNRQCVNPNHLSWKNSSENQLDRRVHGTTGAGRKLTKKEWGEIRALKGKKTQAEIAEMYGVSFQSVSFLHRNP